MQHSLVVRQADPLRRLQQVVVGERQIQRGDHRPDGDEDETQSPGGQEAGRRLVVLVLRAHPALSDRPEFTQYGHVILRFPTAPGAVAPHAPDLRTNKNIDLSLGIYIDLLGGNAASQWSEPPDAVDSLSSWCPHM